MGIVRIIETILFPFQYLRRMGTRFLRFGGKSLDLSLASKITLALVLLLLITWVSMVVYVMFTDMREPGSWWSFYVYAPILIAVTGAFCYFGVQLLAYQKPSLYPEIDQCWDKLEEWMETENLSFDDVPFYLVLGTHSVQFSDVWHDGQRNLQLNGVPKGDSEWLHWYGNDEGMYLHVKKCSTLSNLNEKLMMASRDGTTAGSTATLADPGDFGASLAADDYNEEDTWRSSSLMADTGDFGGSLTPDAVDGPLEPMGDDSHSNADADSPPAEGMEVASDDVLDRLKYICERFRRANPTYLPVQGVLLVLPFEPFCGGQNSNMLAEAARNDLLELQTELGLSLPVSLAFAGMEKTHGFLKLQHLIGKSALNSRFGKGIKLGDIPRLEHANLELLGEQACFTFETWVMNKYQDPARLSYAMQCKDLYRLLFKVRSQFGPRLQQFLYSLAKDDVGQLNDSLTLTGCYFCATGEARDSRGFVGGILQKLGELAELCGWNSVSAQREQWRSVAANLLFAGALVLFLLAGVLLYNKLGRRDSAASSTADKVSRCEPHECGHWMGASVINNVANNQGHIAS